MAATFSTKINAVRTASANGLTQAIKQVDFSVVGEQAGQRFELPQTVELADPDPAAFNAFPTVSEAMVKTWVEAAFDERMPAVRAHIQFVLDREAAKAALTADALPWAPAVPAAPTPGQAAAPVAPAA